MMNGTSVFYAATIEEYYAILRREVSEDRVAIRAFREKEGGQIGIEIGDRVVREDSRREYEGRKPA